MTFSAPLVHTIPQDNGPVYHTESVGAYDQMDDLQEKFDEMQREVKALRGKDLLFFHNYLTQPLLINSSTIHNSFKLLKMNRTFTM